MKTHLSILTAWLLLLAGVHAQPFGLTNRPPNTSLQMPANPARLGYALTNAFGTLAFTSPVAIVSPPGETNRLFVVEQRGIVAVITNLANPTRSIFLDLTNRIVGGVPSNEQGLLGLAFHPGYATNGFFYVYYTLSTTTTNLITGPQPLTGNHQRLSRFQVSGTNSNVAETNSELPLLTMYDEAPNHNGGCLQFGPDNYLYVSLGDEGDQNDTRNNSQRIDRDFWSGLLRLDVDKKPGSLTPNFHAAHRPQGFPSNSLIHYAVPPDNPFVGATTFNGTAVAPSLLRTEFWAVGMRNPWRFSFDVVTGQLYLGDVGGDLWEEVNIVTKGGNYGWAFREGFVNGPKSGSMPGGFSSIAPIANYAHSANATNQGRAIIGGMVYRGTALSQLYGAYVFADNLSGNVWMLRADGTNAVPFHHLLTDTGIAGFGVDPRNGDILTADQNQNLIKRLVYNATSTGTPLPTNLSGTGAFADLATLTPAAGVVPYDLNVPFWSDNAKKSRWFSVPNTNLTLGFSAQGNWTFPTGMVWVKHFELELTNGVPASSRRLETRLLVRNSDGVYGVTYRWTNNTGNALLVPEAGLDEDLVINDGGLNRTQTWHYPSRGECLVCHTPVAGHALGFNTAQLNRDFNYSLAPDNQLRALERAGYFSSAVTNRHLLPRLAHATNDAWSLEWRVRSYLAANCAQCHQPGGAGLGSWDARIVNPLSLSGLPHGALNNNLGDALNRVIVPNDLVHSVLLQRISTNAPLRMPPLASSVLDSNAIALVSAWITNGLAGYQTFAQWQVARFGSTNAPLGGATNDYDGDLASNYQEYLAGTDPTVSGSVWKISARTGSGLPQVVFDRIPNRGLELQMTTSLQPPLVWQPLNVVENQPFFALTNAPFLFQDASGDETRYYRVRLYEP